MTAVSLRPATGKPRMLSLITIKRIFLGLASQLH